MLILGLLIIVGSQRAGATTGIFHTAVTVANFVRAGNANAFATPAFEGAVLGLKGYSPGNPGLILEGAEVRTFKNGTSDVTGATLFYRVYLLGSTTRGSASPAYTAVNLPFGANLAAPGDQLWSLTGANINLSAGLTQQGTYVVEVFWRASTNEGDRFDSNGGNNFVATFGFTGSPLCGTYTVDNSLDASATNFTSFGTAFNSLNAAGIACGTTFNVRDNTIYPENNVQLNAVTGTSAAARVTFQRDNSTAAGANVRPVVRPLTNAGGGTQDAVIKLSGADFITFNGIDVSDTNSAGGTNAQKIEYGYALFRASPTDGCQSNIIRNCAVTLNKTNSNTVGIYGTNENISAVAQSAGATASGSNSGNEFDGNTITNSYWGISLLGGTSALPDLGNKIGSTLGNTISDIGGTVAATVHGIKADFQQDLRIEKNDIVIPTGTTGNTILHGISCGSSNAAGVLGSLVISNNTVRITSATTGPVYGIRQNGGSALGSVTITGNTVQNSLLSGVNTNAVTWILDASSNPTSPQTVTISGNQVTGNSTATTGIVYGISRTGVNASAVTIASNQITNNTKSGAGQFYGIQVANATPVTTPVVVSSNQITGNQITATSGTLFSANVNSGAVTFNANTIANNTIPNNTDAASVYGYFQNGTPSSETLTSNTITGLSVAGPGTGTANEVRGISTSPGSASPQTFTRNTVGALSIAGTNSGTVTGIYLLGGGGTGTSIARNKIYDLSAAGAGGAATGIAQTGGGTFTYANNLLGDFRAPAANASNAVNGLSLTGGTAANVYFNTVYLNAGSTGTNFGTSGMLVGAAAPVADLRNNLIVNLSTANGTGTTAALRRNGANTTNANFAATTDRNLYWAGTPSATNVIFTDGTVTAQDLAAYKLLLAPREANSLTENPPFLSTIGSSASFLKIDPTVATQVESRGRPVAGIADDFDGDTRNAVLPDLGADEGTFTRTAAPLPVELTAFEATRQGSTAALTWATASEQNNRGFEVQASADGRTFQALAFVAGAGAGSSSTPHRYAYTDREAGKTGLRYYRLRQVDTDGRASFSPVRTVAFGPETTLAVGAVPNPFEGELLIAAEARTAQAAPLTLFDAVGRVVLTRWLEVAAGPNRLPVAGLAGLPAGTYFGQLLLDGQLHHFKAIRK
ncbi:hypothetical protein GCM10022407_31600 [Hymenobacter antarcticus]|uniref:T9SS type A sorting domain-containing protein n=2 Tax=Hymenobacter antarcticus TaxID=486270 RepID=A0ABP7QKR8_9BACT